MSQLFMMHMYANYLVPTDEHGKVFYYTSDIAHRDGDGDYQVYGRVNDAIRYRGELLNLPSIEGAAVSRVCPNKVLIMAFKLMFAIECQPCKHRENSTGGHQR